ncbi:restriction endonuclease subunit S [Serratia marcescens]|uniref:restriction endonuclease subunit S n=1 Tax=Serratia TaxID=613 RepID=UPI0008FFB8A3|nr:restriction endonuclease subunit S [Serratia sp. FS14]
MMPEGWQLSTIEKIATVSSGGTPSRKNASYWNGNIPWVTTAEVQFKTIIDTAEKITVDGLTNSSAKLFPKDTILMAMYGQGKTRGQVAKLGIEATTNQACAAILLKEGYDIDYYYQFLIHQYENIREMSNSGGQENLSAGIVKSIQVPVPPIFEQKKIAQILCTWDKAITTTEQLLTNIQQQKKKLMQQLLTGKKRFPEFSGEWKEVYLGDICQPQQWVTISSSDLVDSGYPVYGANGFIGYYSTYNHECETVAVTCRGSTCGEVSLIPGRSYITGNSMCLDSIDENENSYLFLYQLLKFRGFKDVISGSAQPQIVGKAIKKIKLNMPSISEQIKIASVLSVFDQQNETLQQKLFYLKQEKKALMQQLLTGKRRVKAEAA